MQISPILVPYDHDIARWGIKDATLPRSVISLGGRFGYTDQGETPNTQVTFMDFGDTKMIFEVRGLRTQPLHGAAVGNLFHCEEGTVISPTQFIPKGKTTPEPLPRADRNTPRGPGGTDHFRNFVEAVRTKRRADLNANILEGHFSSALCHLGNISYRLGQNVPASRRNNPLGDNADARETLQRMEEHLVRGNDLKLEDLVYKVGVKLDLDVAKENFVGNAAANRLLTRDYRTGYVVPQRVS